MTTEFDSLNLLPELVQAVTALGYETPTPVQSAVIPLMLSGKDVIAQAQTGTGKTAAFALPILQNLHLNQRHVQALVLAPTRELALQDSEAFADYGQFAHPRILAIYGGSSYNRQISQLRRGVEIVVGTPGRLLDLMRKEILDISQVRTVVLDEADEMLSMGFSEDIEAILSATPHRRQTALFSATLPPEIRRLADRYLVEPQTVLIEREKVTVDTIAQRYYLVNASEKAAALTRLFETEEIGSALIFVRTRLACGELANELNARGFAAEVLNGDMTQESREQTLLRFRQNKLKVLVATDVAARGLDIDDLSHVINVELPPDPEIYVHRIGRTGRAGKPGVAISLVSPSEKRYLRQVEAFTHQKIARHNVPTEADILTYREERLLQQLDTWLRRGRCRREREIVEKLVEQGHDPLEVAAVALKIARADEKQRPIAHVGELTERADDRGRYERRSRPEQGSHYSKSGERYSNAGERERVQEVSHESGMVRLSLNRGRVHGLRPNDIVGAIAAHASIPGNRIGKIHIHDERALVDIPQELVAQVLSNHRPLHIQRQRVEIKTG